MYSTAGQTDTITGSYNVTLPTPQKLLGTGTLKKLTQNYYLRFYTDETYSNEINAIAKTGQRYVYYKAPTKWDSGTTSSTVSVNGTYSASTIIGKANPKIYYCPVKYTN